MADNNAADWFVCLACRCRLAPVEVRKGRTVIPGQFFGIRVWVDRAEFICPNCGQVRRFNSAQVNGRKEMRGTQFMGLT